MRTWLLLALVSCCLTGLTTGCTTARLGSWNETQPREDIADFVARVSTPGSPDYVPPAQRIAVFDNDGTLWAEQPAYFQLLFAIDRVRAMAPDHPEWRRTQPFQAVLEGDNDALIASGNQGLLQIIAATHTGMTTEEFDEAVRTWITTARHPDTDRLYSDMIYTPMLELLEYLRARGFKTFIVSGGGIDFMRVFAEEVYGIPPEQVIGSSIKTEFAMTPGGPVIRRLPEVNFIDDKEGKPVGIHMHIGRRPILAGGNSDGDLQMLQWTAAGDGPSLCLLVHHTDAQREWAYDRDSHIGRLDAALDQARADGWTVIDMKNDWSRVFEWQQ
jgi:phosphoglycolate phosphatase-like HAD superfamily hydrolase